MATENKIPEIIRSSMENIRSMFDADNIIGDPITTEQGVTIIPVSKVSLGIASGGVDFKNEKNGQNAPAAQNGKKERPKSFGGGGGSRPAKFRGSDQRVKVKLTLQEIANGVTKKFKINKYVTCPHCHGSGSEDGKKETCEKCKGSGVTYRTMQTMFGHMQTQTECDACGGTGSIIRNKCKHFSF